MKRKLKRLLNPRTIAVIGASANEGKVGNTLMKKLSDFKGVLIPINPSHAEILGKKSYPSVLQYPKKIDLAIIAIPAQFVKQALEECGIKKIKNVIIISAGFSEVGNKQAEEELKIIIQKYRLNVLGPNCFGITNPYLKLDTTFSNNSARKGDIAFISQSGALWSYIADLSASDEIGFTNYVSLGNMADLTFSDFISYFNKDKNTKKIILYIERLNNGREFINVCRKSKKPIIAIKAGKSAKGIEATMSHTASLATDYEIYKGAFNQAHVNLMPSIAQAFGLKEQDFPLPKNKKLEIITNAGGAGALLTDFYSEKGFEILTVKDVIGTALAKDYTNELERLKAKKCSILIIFTPQSMSQAEETAQAVVNFKNQTKKDIITFFLGDKSITKAKAIFEKNKIPCITQI